MKPEVKSFIERAVKNLKDNSFVRKHLEEKISEVELIEALNYFNYLNEKEGKKIKRKLKKIFYPIKIILLYLIFITLKTFFSIKGFIKKEKYKKVTFEEFLREIEINGGPIEEIRKWFSKKTTKEKILIIGTTSIIFFSFVILIYANFFYYAKCPNKTCFEDRISLCQRTFFENEDFILLFNKVYGQNFKKCDSEVIYKDKQKNKKLKMYCKLPLNYSFFPYQNIELCTGELREHLQDLIITEIHSTIGENIVKINKFLKE